MGVDYYNCEKCGEIFPDCGYFSSCGKCGSMYCQECGEDQEGVYGEDEEGELIGCDNCNKELSHERDMQELLRLKEKYPTEFKELYRNFPKG